MNTPKTKIQTVTVPVEFVRRVLRMRQIQRRLSHNSAYATQAKIAEKEVDEELDKIGNELVAMQAKVEDALQDGLL